VFNHDYSTGEIDYNITATDYFTRTYTDKSNLLDLELLKTQYSENPAFNITKIRTTENISNYTITPTSYNYSTETADLLIQHPDYFNKTISSNFSDSISAQLHQNELTIYAEDTLIGTTIENFNVSTSFGTYTTTNGSILLKMLEGNYSIEMASITFENKTKNYTAETLQKNNMTFYLERFFIFNIYDETTGEFFNTNETESTRFSYYCKSGETLTYDVNVTDNQNSIYLPVGCNWDFIMLNIKYSDTSYYRTLIPGQYESTIDWYMLDINEVLGVQITFKLNDLVGIYEDGSLIVKTSVNDTEVIITKQNFDAESKVTTYLIKDNYYTLSLESSDGTSTRNIGYIIPESAGEKTIMVPEISFMPEKKVGNSITWNWGAETISLDYQDTLQETSQINFTVYNSTKEKTILYNTIENSPTKDNRFSYIPEQNASMVACFTAVIPNGTVSDCHTYYDFAEGKFGNIPTFTEEKQKKVFNLLMLIVVFIIIVAAGQFFPEAMLFSGFMFLVLIQAGVFDMGATRNYGILIMLFLLGGISILVKHLWGRQ